MRREPARRERAEGFGISADQTEDGRTELLAALRRHIARLDHSLPHLDGAPSRSQPWRIGAAAVDRHLPAQGLARTGLHDVRPKAYGDMPAAMGFTLALALLRLADAAERRPLLWCRLAAGVREHGRLYGHGLETLGLPRRRFVTATLKRPADLLWTAEEALKSGALALVLADADAAHADLTATRRLALAAAAGKSAGVIVFAGPAAAATASHTRWTVAASPSRAPPHDALAPGSPAWAVELTRARGGRPGAWTLEWHDAPYRFDLVPGLSRGAIHPWTDEAGAGSAAPAPALRAG